MPKRRRSSILSGLDTSNVIPSPSSPETTARRRSLRLRRNSLLFRIQPAPTPDTSVSQPLPSPILPPPSVALSDDTTSSALLNQTQIFGADSPGAPNRRMSFYIDNPPSPSTESPPRQPPPDCSLHEQENRPPHPVQSPPSWLTSRYSPPKVVGLESLVENRVLRSKRNPVPSSKPSNNLLRFHVFTGQTLDEACQPKFPGAAPLDPKLVLALTRRRTRFRQQKARQLGFKDITVSKTTERRFSVLMRTMHESMSSPDS